MPGAELAGVRYLRDLDDSDALKAAFRPDAQVVVIGAGWIGLETAAAARAAGAAVTVLESAALPLLRVLGAQMATVFADLHRDNGVDLRCEVSVAAIRPAQGDPSTVGGVELGDGTRARRGRGRGRCRGRAERGARALGRPRGRGRHPRRRAPAHAPTRTCSLRATSRTPSTRCSAGASAWSTGRTR